MEEGRSGARETASAAAGRRERPRGATYQLDHDVIGVDRGKGGPRLPAGASDHRPGCGRGGMKAALIEPKATIALAWLRALTGERNMDTRWTWWIGARSPIGPRGERGGRLRQGGRGLAWAGGLLVAGCAVPHLMVNDGRWHHVAFVVSAQAGGGLSLYLDGVERLWRPWTGGTPEATTTTEPLQFARYPGAEYFRGLLDDVRVYDRWLTREEMRALYDFGLAGRCADVP